MEKCIIYGAGNWGKRAYQEYKSFVDVLFFIDKNAKRQGERLLDKEICSVDTALEYKDIMILIAVADNTGIEQMLYRKGFTSVEEYYPGKPFYALRFDKADASGIDYYQVNLVTFPKHSPEYYLSQLKKYDVISFDIFDTSIFRKVEYPTDVFRLMGYMKGHHDYKSVRIRAERIARQKKDAEIGTREVTLEDIYDILNCYYGIPRGWMYDEIQLEIELSEVNPVVFRVYEALKKLGKTVVFSSDMYLPKETIVSMLEKNGYSNPQIYLSCVEKENKGTGNLYDLVKRDFAGKRIAHLGDNYLTDVCNANKKDVYGLYFEDSRFRYREKQLKSLSASIYRSVINNCLNSPLWDKNIYFTHGFRVGGILVAGYCEFLNIIIKKYGIDKVLFCARDCEIIHRIYNQHFFECSNEYICISRRAILEVAGDEFFYDYLERGILRYLDDYKDEKTIGEIFRETGFDYLISKLDEADIEISILPSKMFNYKERIRLFLFDNKKLICEQVKPFKSAALQYFREKIGNHKRILIVDIGWSGTCILALKNLLLGDSGTKDLYISGALMCGSSSNSYLASTENGDIHTYVYSAVNNADIYDFIMPDGETKQRLDYLHMPLEYLFTSCDPSLYRYAMDKNGKYSFLMADNVPENGDEICSMQDGISEFVNEYLRYRGEFKCVIDPYAAFMPLKEAVEHDDYCMKVYGHFLYDATKTPFDSKRTSYCNEFSYEANKTIPEIKHIHIEHVDNELIKEIAGQTIVSLTSYPKRIKTVVQCMTSLLNQTVMPKKILLWLSEQEFPKKERNLPEELIEMALKNPVFEIKWVKDNLKPHKKYYYAMQEYSASPVITVDDDVIYDSEMVESLIKSYIKHPDCVSCMQAHYITMNQKGEIRKYNGWLHRNEDHVGIPSYRLMAIGVGGVIYPPGIMPNDTFDKQSITEVCLVTDDLWLKTYELHAGIRTVLAAERCEYAEIAGTQEDGLFKDNQGRGGNDLALKKILDFFDRKYNEGNIMSKRFSEEK